MRSDLVLAFSQMTPNSESWFEVSMDMFSQSRNWISQRPEFLFLLLVSLVIGGGLASGPSWISNFVLYLFNPNPDPSYVPIHAVTFAAVWSVFVLGIWVCRKQLELNLLRSILVSASIPFGGTGLFEIVYQILGGFSQPKAFDLTLWGYFGLIVFWSSLSLTALPYWRMTKAELLILALTGIGFLSWFAIGYPQVTWGSFLQQPVAYVLNSLLKVSCLLVFLFPIQAKQSEPKAFYSAK